MKIVGYTVGTSVPKSDFAQTDPTKADYIKNKPDFDGLQKEISNISSLVGDRFKEMESDLTTIMEFLIDANLAPAITDDDGAIIAESDGTILLNL